LAGRREDAGVGFLHALEHRLARGAELQCYQAQENGSLPFLPALLPAPLPAFLPTLLPAFLPTLLPAFLPRDTLDAGDVGHLFLLVEERNPPTTKLLSSRIFHHEFLPFTHVATGHLRHIAAPCKTWRTVRNQECRAPLADPLLCR
jgi:hypothetical protein